MKRILSIVLLLASSMMSFGQTVVENPCGKLKKMLKDTPDVTELKIIGEMSYKDIITILSLNNLLSLDISEVTLIEGGSSKWNVNGKKGSDYFSENKMYFHPNMPLQTLKVSDKFKLKYEVLGKESALQLNDLFYKGEFNPTEGRYNHDYFLTYRLKSHNLHWEISPENLKEHYREKSRIGEDKSEDGASVTFDILYLDNIDQTHYYYLDDCNPECIVFGDGTKMLIEYRDSEKNVDLSQYVAIYDKAFANTDIETINLGENIKSLPDGCFYGCKSLTSIQGLENIEHIGKNVFFQVPISAMTFSEKLKTLDGSAFDESGLKEIEFESRYAPQIQGSASNLIKIAFTIPKDSRETFELGDWKNINVVEKGVESTYNFTVEKPGTLGQFINAENAKRIQNLTISGFLNDLDFKYIRMCKNLKVLDLTYCYTTKSEETAASEEALSNAIMGLVGLAIDMAAEEAQHKYEVGTGSLKDATYYTITSEYTKALMEQSKNGTVKSDKNCYISQDALEGLDFLQEIRFPLQLETVAVRFPYTKSINKIVLPPAVKRLSIRYCNLDELVLPETLEEIGNDCFSYCTINVLDMKNTKITYFPNSSFSDCKINIFKAPKGLSKVSSYFKLDNIGACYFYSNEEPERLWIPYDYKNCHIRKGVKAGWKEENVIDDIEE